MMVNYPRHSEQSGSIIRDVLIGIITVFVLLGAAAFSISQSFRTYQDEFR